MPNPARRKPVAVADAKAEPFEIGGVSVAPGKRATIDLPISVLFDHTPMSLTVHVVHGRRRGQ